MEQPRTIRSLLSATTPWLEKHGSSSARLDAELLVAHALSLKRLDLYLDLDRPLSEAEVARCREFVRRRGQGEPVAYILGEKDFWQLRLLVTPDVLIPRPETELLVEEALKLIPDDATGVVVDVCTGSGCVGLALLSEREGIAVVGTDVSARALAVAQQNAERAGLADRFSVQQGDLLAPVAERRDVLLVVGNPPYVKRGAAELEPQVAAHEPALALYGEDDDALGHHRRIIEAAGGILAADGAVLLEIGHDQGSAARALLRPPFCAVAVLQDLSRHDRVLRLSQ